MDAELMNTQSDHIQNTNTLLFCFILPQITSHLMNCSNFYRNIVEIKLNKKGKRNEDGSFSFRTIARQPLPLDPNKPSLAQLSGHIILLILDSVRQTDPRDLHALAQVNTSFYQMTRYVQLHTVKINLMQSGAWKRLKFLSKNSLLHAVRVLELGGHASSDFNRQEEGWNKTLQLLGNTIQRMTGLRNLHWHVGCRPANYVYDYGHSTTVTIPIPVFILEHLDPRVRLHTSIICGYSIRYHEQVREFLIDLDGNRNLVSLSVGVIYREWQECRKATPLLKRIILSCPNLTRIPQLVIRHFNPHQPLEGIWDRHEMNVPYCGLGFEKGERPPALKELGIDGYPWGFKYPPGYAGSLLDLPGMGYPEKGTELDYWSKTFDWSQLVTLNDCYLLNIMFSDLAPRLGRLKEVIFKNGPGYFEIEGVTSSTTAHLLQDLPSTLSLLSLLSWSHVYDNPTAITRHGPTLEKLQIHAPNCRKSKLLTNQQLLPLCNGLPHLRELAIDIGRDKENNDWPWMMFDNIARLPRVQVVRLWFKIGDNYVKPLAPYLTADTASQIFSYLHA